MFGLAAQEREPDDSTIHLRLAWTLNMLKRDAEAIAWFERARHAIDPKIAAEADRAYRNLRPQFAPVRFTVWSLPMYSTRWRAGFSYGQFKSEFRVGTLPIRPYLSLRFVGDTGTLLRQAPVVNGALSERAVIPATGLSSRLGPVTLWTEAGFLVPFGKGQSGADYRGGASYGKVFGKPLPGKGWFVTTNADTVFVSRFAHDTFIYSLNHSVIQSLNHSIIQSFNHSIVQSFNHSFTLSFGCLFYSFVPSFIRSFIRPFAHLVID